MSSKIFYKNNWRPFILIMYGHNLEFVYYWRNLKWLNT